MKSIGRIFLTGILTILPILATIYLAVWLFAAVERFLGKQLLLLMPDEYYRAGMGLLAALVLIFLIGLLMRAWLFRQLVKLGESLLLKIPLIKVVYRSLKDLFGLFSDEKNSEALQVVSVQLPGTDMRLLGFLTRSDFSDLPKGVGNEDEVAVYLPMSYQVGGYTVMIPRNRVTPVPMSREEAMRFVLTAGLKTEAKQIELVKP
ncbi:MAG TPA: DUF502 domain-containing protein [Burkholderiales bacterium]|jgi:uncharacterized membrane protein|nr:DUF502 domain-containing protein [Burkholderiales bacterium]